MKSIYRTKALFILVAVSSLICTSEAFGQYTNASSLWLNYTPSPKSHSANIVMTDFSIDSTALYTYYAALVWNNGYAGVQRGGDGYDKDVHFSLWDPSTGPTSQVVWHAPDVVVQRFGGEGTGWKAAWPFNWQENETYTLLVKCEVEDTVSDYDAWFFDYGKFQWKHLATFQYPAPISFTYLSSFIEDWEGTPQEYRSYSLFNVMERLNPMNLWYKVPSATYSVNGTDPNCNGEVKDGKFFIASGGTITPTNPTGTLLTIPTSSFQPQNPQISDVAVVWEPDDTLAVAWSFANNFWSPQESYRIRIAQDKQFSNIVYDGGSITSSDTMDLIPNLKLDSTKTYYVSIDSKTILGDSTNETASFTGSVITDIRNDSQLLPNGFRLDQNYPNPFNPTTNIGFSLFKGGYVSLQVYNVLGQEVAQLLNARETPGYHNVAFNGSSLPSGVYFYRLVGEQHLDQMKMLLLK